MDQWVLPTTIFLLGFLVWLFGFYLSRKSAKGAIYAAAGAIALIGLLLLWKRGYVVLPASLIAMVGLTLIIAYGFDISFQKATPQGPFAHHFGKVGIAETNLEPKGTIEVDGTLLPASTEGVFVKAESRVKIIRTGAKFVIVEKVED